MVLETWFLIKIVVIFGFLMIKNMGIIARGSNFRKYFNFEQLLRHYQYQLCAIPIKNTVKQTLKSFVESSDKSNGKYIRKQNVTKK